MKMSTRVADINRHLAIRSAKQALKTAEELLLKDTQKLSRRNQPEEASQFFQPVVEAHRVLDELLSRRLSKARSSAARDVIEQAEEHVQSILSYLGEDYSGVTSRLVEWGDAPSARTVKRLGKFYSGKSPHRRTDADHIVTLEPEGVIHALANKELCKASRAAGLPIIALYPDGQAVWVMLTSNTSSKEITFGRGWVAYELGICGHSDVSLAGARQNLGEHLRQRREREAERRQETRTIRRTRLVAKLCKGVKVTLADAKALGYCDPGIRAFQGRYGIGDSAMLCELIMTGDHYAIALAMEVARKLKQKKNERTKTDRTTDGAGVPAAV